jgi:tetratricopeptide (TPR) repeat protein
MRICSTTPMLTVSPNPVLQLSERRKGNSAYRAAQYEEALEHYTRARSIVELVKGLSRADQAEVDINRIAIACNIAAAHLATKDYGAAVEACEWALAIDPTCRKALIRRAKARLGRHDYVTTLNDIKILQNTHPDAPEVLQLQCAVKKAIEADKMADRRVFSNMFERAKRSEPC